MVLELSLFQIFFMALSIIGLSFSVLYLFIGGYSPNPEMYRETQREYNRDESRENVVDIHRGRQTAAAAKPPPIYRTSVGRQTRVVNSVRKQASGMRVIEVDYRVVQDTFTATMDEITLNTISRTGT